MTDTKLFTIIVITENKPGVLYRIADIFLKRKINIESLSVSETEQKGLSQFTILIKTEKETLEKMLRQIGKIIEVVKVFEAKGGE
jgi:acetolactate synthase-1/3 small subunit